MSTHTNHNHNHNHNHNLQYINLQINVDNTITWNHSKRDNVDAINLLSYGTGAFII